MGSISNAPLFNLYRTTNRIQEHINYLHPSVGDLKWSITNYLPNENRWLLCNGQEVSRADYPELFTILGNSFGIASNPATKFKLPNADGRVLAGVGDSRTQGNTTINGTLGMVVGNVTHNITVDEMPSHTHIATDSGHTHGYIKNTNDQNVNSISPTNETAADQADLPETTGLGFANITIAPNGGDQAMSLMQPTLFIGYLYIYGGTITNVVNI